MSQSRKTSVRIVVWDIPIRVFHWILVACVVAAYVTAKLGGALADWHGRIGALVLGLLIFRIIWGFIGSSYARFSQFFPTPSRIISYLRGNWEGTGHNPIGALSVFALLGSLTVIVATGLFANDDIAFQGPLYHLIDKSVSDNLTHWHEVIFNVLALLVALHIAAIAFYLKVKKDNLVIPMLTGIKEVPEQHVPATIKVAGWRFLVAAIFSTLIAWGIFSGKIEEIINPVKPAPVAATPDW